MHKIHYKMQRTNFYDDLMVEYSLPLTQELVNLLCEAGVKYIYADSTEQGERDGLTPPPGCDIKRTINGNFHHFHINISYP